MGRSSRLKAIRKDAKPLKLDFGCGPHKSEGFQGVDAIAFDGVDHVVDLRRAPWPWKDGTVEEARASHFVEHLTAMERIVFVNELYRILVPGGSCQIVTPHWASSRAYGDPTHQWPPVSEFWFYYLSQEWRTTNAPHTDKKHLAGGYACDFEATWGYSLRPDLNLMHDERRQFAVQNYKEAVLDMAATLKKK